MSGADLYDPQTNYFKRGSHSYNEVDLTIDDGPHPGSIENILDTLKQEHVTATFFVVGIRVKQAPQLVKRMIDEGHEVGNHTQDHIRLDTLDEKHVRAEIVNCAKNVAKATGRGMRYLRPPGMRINDAGQKVIKDLGYITIGDNVGAKDFIPGPKDGKFTPEYMAELNVPPSVIADRVVKQLKPGVIILLHDNPITARALPEIIHRVRAQGYEFRSTFQMMSRLSNFTPVDPNPVIAANNHP
jgi:peptidoglycan-N-acetylmuramic acid deacetylase